MNKRKLFSTDTLMKSLWRWLVRDFRSNLDDPSFMTNEEALLENMPEFRKLKGGDYFLSPYAYFKCRYQMENLFKRYVFNFDLYDSQALNNMTNEKFIKTQEFVGYHKHPTHRAFLVLQKARTIAREILGSYDLEEHYQSCRFGKRASVGVPKAKSYLDERLSVPLSGSRAHIKWFKDYLSSDKNLERILCDIQNTDEPQYELCETLTLTNVPKSYKSLRSIMPNTTIGGFYSYGLGRMIQRRLTDIGLDIRRLQSRHRRLVRLFSRTRTHVTADLSAASDSFTWALMNRVLPRDWLNKLNFGRIRSVRIDEKTYHASSFMTMGIGFTFQAQTLVFYCLLKSMQELTGIKGLISVYGDDLIYPKGLHRFVSQIFTDIGFSLNQDKTYVYESFRESCGEDCYCGVGVRPFQPKGSSQQLSAKEYLVLLYKTINGLRRRWDEVEITQTLRYLYQEVLRVDDVILQVPPSFPDFSGVQVDRPRHDFLLPWAEIKTDHNWSLSFAALYLHPRDRFVVHQAPYLWDKLRDPQDWGLAGDDWNEDFFLPYSSVPPDVFKLGVFRWVKTVPAKFTRSSISGKRLRRLAATVASKSGSFSVIRQTGTTNAWS